MTDPAPLSLLWPPPLEGGEGGGFSMQCPRQASVVGETIIRKLLDITYLVTINFVCFGRGLTVSCNLFLL